MSIVLALFSGFSLNGGCLCVDPSLDPNRNPPFTDAAPPNGSPAIGAATRDGATGTGVVIAAAGDIACGSCEQAATADVMDELLRSRGLAAILPLGDEAYDSGLLTEFQDYYRPSWGRQELLALTHPVPGNHEYVDGLAAGYFDFFDGPGQDSGIAGPRGTGYYSFDLGGWHIIALNTNDDCRWISCSDGSPQHQWLVSDLAAHPSLCTLAYWHHPRFQAGTTSGEATSVAPLWDALYDAGVDVVLNGHEHGYQQLAPLDKSGTIDPARGMRTFIVGTGGGDFDTAFGGPRLGALETSIVGTHGVLELTLRPTSFDWQFVTAANSATATAAGTSPCH